MGITPFDPNLFTSTAEKFISLPAQAIFLKLLFEFGRHFSSQNLGVKTYGKNFEKGMGLSQKKIKETEGVECFETFAG